MKVYQKIVAAIFTISLFAFSAYNFLTMKGFITGEIKEIEKPETVKEMKYYTASIDSGLSSNMVFGHFWNEAYGAIYSFIGKNEENSFKYVRDKNGFLFTANFWNYPDVEAREYVRRVKRIQDKLADRDTKVIFLLCPTQYNEAYYYKNNNEKLAIGPLWDYDNCFDNYSGAIADYEYLSFASQPWFEELVKDKTFQSKLVKRYKELRKTILSDAYVNEFIDKTMNYLGNARSRDFSRWKNAYNESHKLDILKDEEGFIIDRNTYSVEAEVQRMKDILSMHGKWMDKNIGTSLASFTETKVETAKIKSYSWIIVMGIAAFFSMLVLINRKMNGA